MDEILIVPYDPAWPSRFEQEVAHLRTLVPERIIRRWEHFGSTAVPGLAAKPIVDILGEISSLEEAIREAIPSLEQDGYSWWRANPKEDHLFLVKGLPPNGPRTHHLHLIEQGHPAWERLLFRDALRNDPEARKEYAELKRALARLHRDDREAYTQAKTEFVHRITRRSHDVNNAAGSAG